MWNCIIHHDGFSETIKILNLSIIFLILLLRKEFVVLMKKFKHDQMKGGWFVGNFEPSGFKTENFEVGYLEHKKGASILIFIVSLYFS